MDLNSTYKERPAMVCMIVIIVAAVGVYTLIQAAFVDSMIDQLNRILAESGYTLTPDDIELFRSSFVASCVVSAALSFIIAFLIYSGSNLGKVLLTIIVIVSILAGVGSIVMGYYESIITMVLAVVVLLLLYQPPVKAYFRK